MKRFARVGAWLAGCLALLYIGAASSQSMQSDTHLVYCENASGFPSFVMGVGDAGMQSALPLVSKDGGVTVSVNDGNRNGATLDCRVGCTQTSGSGFCLPLQVRFKPLNFAVTCPVGPRDGQVWATSAGQSDGATCQATVVNGATTGWTCTTVVNNTLSEYAFDCTKGCSFPGACECIGGACPPAGQ